VGNAGKKNKKRLPSLGEKLPNYCWEKENKARRRKGGEAHEEQSWAEKKEPSSTKTSKKNDLSQRRMGPKKTSWNRGKGRD